MKIFIYQIGIFILLVLLLLLCDQNISVGQKSYKPTNQPSPGVLMFTYVAPLLSFLDIHFHAIRLLICIQDIGPVIVIFKQYILYQLAFCFYCNLDV